MASVLVKGGELLAAGIGVLYGLAYLGVALAYSFRQREFWRGLTDFEKAHLGKASGELWSLTNDTGPIEHRFLRLLDGSQLHYLTPRASPDSPDTLVVLLHGFPDSAHLFSRQLRSLLAQNARLVALDLPGCGGSDSLATYGPNQVLNPVIEAIAEFKRLYLPSKSQTRCVLVGHDWGGVVGFRIAAETEGVIDHLITLNSLYPAYAEETLTAHVSRGSELLSQWKFNEAMRELAPVWSQLQKSGYTYMVTLPFPIAKIMPRVASCLLKYAHGMEYERSHEAPPEVIGNRLAMAYGPSAIESALSTANSPSYGHTVLARSKTSVPGDWDGRVRLYADGLLRDEWVQSKFDVAGAIRAQTTDAVAGETKAGPQSFKCPVHIIFGLKDVALDPRIIVDGIEKYFHPTAADAGKYIIRLPECGHWSILQEKGAEALETILENLVGQ